MLTLNDYKRPGGNLFYIFFNSKDKMWVISYYGKWFNKWDIKKFWDIQYGHFSYDANFNF